MPSVFVFGTLKQGFPLHERGLAGSGCLGSYQTVERFPMFIAGPWFSPAMLHEPGSGRQVIGELYNVDEERLRRLDVIESVGQPGNLRIEIMVMPARGGPPSPAFAYFKAREIAAPIRSEYLSFYEDRRFIPPEQRS